MFPSIEDKTIKIFIQNSPHKINLVLDLDQTIVDCKESFGIVLPEIETKRFTPKFVSKKKTSVLYMREQKLFDYLENRKVFSVYARAGLFVFLNDITNYFNVYVYTNGTYNYAKRITTYIEQHLDKTIFNGIVARSRMSSNEIKTLHHIPDLTEKNTIIIDDRIDVWDTKSKHNVIKIKEYFYIQGNGIHTIDLVCIKNLILEHKEQIQDTPIQKVIHELNKKYNASLKQFSLEFQ